MTQDLYPPPLLRVRAPGWFFFGAGAFLVASVALFVWVVVADGHATLGSVLELFSWVALTGLAGENYRRVRRQRRSTGSVVR